MQQIYTSLVLFGLTLSMAYGDTRLRLCPDHPNCVSSLAQDERQRIEPYRPRTNAKRTWAALHEIVAHWPRTRITEVQDNYLRAEVRSRIFRFIDDLEFEYDGGKGEINIRSAARSGTWDLGVNRRRVESIREILAERGLIVRHNKEAGLNK